MILVMPIHVGLLFHFTGFFPRKLEPDWFAGIRTPGTLGQPGSREEYPPSRLKIIQDCRYRELCRGAGSGSCHLVHHGPGARECACHGCLFLLRLPERAGKILKTTGCTFPAG
jgi:hypothetical protein